MLSNPITGCNEITDNGLWAGLVPNLESLVITDCINIADETVGAITQVLPGLKELTLQAYHVTDSAMSYFGPTALRVNLRVLHLEHCWEIGNQGILSIAHGLPNLTSLSLSGCSKVTDDAIEVIAEQLRHLSSLNLSWCSRITDASLEYIACDLADSLKELILDRFVLLPLFDFFFLSEDFCYRRFPLSFDLFLDQKPVTDIH
jgi:F-box/leucine-rich repeat protein 16